MSIIIKYLQFISLLSACKPPFSGASARSLPDLLIHVEVTLPPPGPHVVLDWHLGGHLLDGDLDRGGGGGGDGVLGDCPVLPGDGHHVSHQVTPLTPRPHLIRLGLAEPGNSHDILPGNFCHSKIYQLTFSASSFLSLPPA